MSFILDLGDIEVTRTFTQKGTKLIVKNKDGALFPSPQAMLDKLVGNLSFDPLEFSRMKPKDQIETLKKVVGLDFDQLNQKHKSLFDERTEINRQGKALKAQREALILCENIPDKEISIAELSKQLTEASDNNNKIVSKINDLAQDRQQLLNIEKQLKELQQSYDILKAMIEKKEASIKNLKPKNLDDLREQINSAEETNKKVRSNQQIKIMDKQLSDLRTQSQLLTDKLNKIDTNKSDLLKNAKFPIQNLEFSDDCIMYEGVPFNQCSAAQRIRVSVAMGLAMNPTLRVLLIREGSLLDSNNMKMIAEMAQKNDAQLWIERVGQGKECSVIIHDGSIKSES